MVNVEKSKLTILEVKKEKECSTRLAERRLAAAAYAKAKTGAEGRTRTGTRKPSKDFKSFASTNFATSACYSNFKFFCKCSSSNRA